MSGRQGNSLGIPLNAWADDILAYILVPTLPTQLSICCSWPSQDKNMNGLTFNMVEG